MRKISLFAMVVVMMVGCEQRPGMDTQDEHITKGEVAIYVAGTMLGYDLNDNSWACTSSFTDVEDNTPLCRSIEILKWRDMSYSYTPWYDRTYSNEFYPDQEVLWLMLWQEYIGPELGYPDYSNPCIATFTDQSPTGVPWNWVGGLCNRSIIRVGDVLTHTDLVTREGWNAFTGRIDEFLNSTSTRIFTLETLARIFVPEEIEIQTPYFCLSHFPDIQNETLTCHIVEGMIDLGYIDGYPDGQFRPTNPLNKAELVKLNVTVFDYYTPQETGCYGAESGMWYAQYMDVLCEQGYLDTDNAPADASESVTNRDVIWLASDLRLLHPRY